MREARNLPHHLQTKDQTPTNHKIRRYTTQRMDASLPYPRHMESAIREAMADTPVVCLLGPRQSGKTTLARRLAEKDHDYVSLDDPRTCAIARSDPMGFVAGLPERAILDEVQRAPGILPALKLAVDAKRKPGRFLLTGSANLMFLPTVTESLAGRMETITLLPLSEAEKSRSAGAFLARFLAGQLAPGIAGGGALTLDAELPGRVVAGGYPEPLLRTPARARQWHLNYLRSLIERDVQDVAQFRDADALAVMMEVLAARTGSLLNVESLATALKRNRETVERMLGALERLFLVRRLPAWHTNDAKRFIKSPKLHIVDSGLAAALCDLKVADWLPDRGRFGDILESFVVAQLVCQAGWTAPDLRFWHYRDKDQNEVDLVITRGQKVWGIEVKAAATVHPDDGKGLRRLAAEAGDDYQGGAVLYSGVHAFALGHGKGMAVPLSWLWDR